MSVLVKVFLTMRKNVLFIRKILCKLQLLGSISCKLQLLGSNQFSSISLKSLELLKFTKKKVTKNTKENFSKEVV